MKNWFGRDKASKPFVHNDPAEVAEARSLDIIEDEIEDGGGWRQDRKGRQHWLKLKHLIEFRKADRRFAVDKDFWDWVDEYLETEKIGQSRGAVNYGSYSGNWSSKPKDYLSDWWKGSGYYGSGTSDNDRKLAVALSAAQSTVGVINMTGKRYVVSYSTKGETYTDLDGEQIKITPEAILDDKIDDDRAIKITTGLALHEGSHTQYTPAVAKILRDPKPMLPLRVSQLLLNILEDLRIERLTADKFPGFASFFGDIYEWGWEQLGPTVAKKWGPDLKEKLGAIVAMTKWPDAYEEQARKDPELSTEFDWWKAWGESYRVAPDTSGARKLVQDALDRLREDPKTKAELDKMAADEEKIQSQAGMKTLSDDEFAQLLENLKQQLGDPSAIQGCPSPGHGSKIQLTPDQAAAVNQLVQDKMEIHFSQFPDQATGKAPKIVVTKPQETAHSKRSYKPANRNLVQRIKAAFFFRKRMPVFDERMLKRGMVDDEQLWRVGDNDFRVFLQRHVEEADFVSATMLVDCSGSMHGSNIERAQMLSTVLLECFSTMPNARARVRGHAYTGGDACNVYRIWEPGDPRSRLGLFSHVPSGSNYDGYAIEYCAAELLKDQRPNETKLLIVLSDGRPNGGHNYSGRPAMQHVRRITDHFGKRDMTVIQIAVDPSVGPADQSAMFANWIPFDAQQLPVKLGKLLIRLFGASQ